LITFLRILKQKEFIDNLTIEEGHNSSDLHGFRIAFEYNDKHIKELVDYVMAHGEPVGRLGLSDDMVMENHIEDHNLMDGLGAKSPIAPAEKKSRWEAMLTILRDCKKKNLLQYIKEEREPETGDPLVSVRLKNENVRSCLLTQGQILELIVYTSIVRSGDFDDVQSSLRFNWYNWYDEEKENLLVANNEIDIVAVKEMKTVFVSCKTSIPTAKDLYEIKYEADHFGLEGIPVIVYSHNKVDFMPVYRRAMNMGVHFIDLEDVKSERIADILSDIVKEPAAR
jgi:hypothetical protein